MRLQLISLAVCAMVFAAAAHSSSFVFAQPDPSGTGQATSRVLVYDDDDETQVVTSILDAEATLPRAVSIGAYAIVDAVSSASVDVVSAATERWDETRVEVGGRASAPLLGNRIGLGVARSQENDWLSHSVLLSTSRELFQRNTVVSAGYAFTQNRVGRAMDPNFERSLGVHAAELAVSQLLDAVTRGGVAYTYQGSAGFQSSPYRYVAASDGSTLAERHPEKRKRHALSGFLMRSLATSVSLRIGYRLYRDDWGIWSHTASARLVYAITERVHAAVDSRYYIQNKADFYRGVYPTSFRYMSGDRELSTFWDVRRRRRGGRAAWSRQARRQAERHPLSISQFPGAARAPGAARRRRGQGGVVMTMARGLLVLMLASSLGCAQDRIADERDLALLDEHFFRCEVQPVLAARCSFMACHGNDERPLMLFAEQRFRLGVSWDDYETPLTEEELAANFRMVRGFARQTNSQADLLVEKPLDTRAGGLFHRGKDLFGRDDVFLDRDDPGFRILSDFVAGARSDENCSVQEEVGP